jgi:hypothetical protein
MGNKLNGLILEDKVPLLLEIEVVEVTALNLPFK